MAVTTPPRPDDILKDKEVVPTGKPRTQPVRGIVPGNPAEAYANYKGKGTVSQVPARALEKRQALSFARLAEDTWIEAYRKYAENPTTQTKAAADAAKADFIKATSNYKNITGNVYETNKVDQKYVGTLPKEPKGFDPLRDRAPGGAQTPGDRAKIDGVPDYIPPNTLDNSRWNPNDFYNNEDPFSYLYKGDTVGDPTVVAFIANENGSIYQDSDGNPIDLVSYVDKVIAEYSNSGKMNELRDLLISSKVTVTPDEVAFLDRAKNMEGSNFSGADFYTRALVTRAVQLTTMSNVTAAGLKTNKSKFKTLKQFLAQYSGGYNYLINQGGGNGYGSGTPRRTVATSKQVYTPEDLELNIDAFFQQYAGQGASKEAVDFLVKELNKKSTQTTVTNNKGNTSSSVTTGGVSSSEEQTMMRDMALQDPAAESFNKATTYLNYFREALASPIELG
jgi:hypothetical protein